MWDFFATVRHRHSVRKYRKDMPVEREKLHAVLEMACAAPSAGDLQAYQIIVVSSQEERDALSRAAGNQEFLSEAPICLIFCADPERSAQRYGERGKSLYTLQDTTIAAAYTQLAVVAAGMGSTWVGAFDEDEVKRILNIEPGKKPVAMLSVGYPAEAPEPTPRRQLNEVVKYR